VPLAGLSEAELARVAAAVLGGAANIADIYPLTPLQEGIFFHHLLAEGSSDAYVLPFTLGFDSRDRIEQFLGALQHVIDRHDIYRTSVAWDGLHKPVQVVWRTALLPVTEVDLDPDASDAVSALDTAASPMTDLTQAPLLRAHVAAEPGTGDWLALLQVHHLVQDHTGLEVVLDEVAAFLSGEGDKLPEPQPFRDFVTQTLLEAADERA
jgi:hypothetical protein